MKKDILKRKGIFPDFLWGIRELTKEGYVEFNFLTKVRLEKEGKYYLYNFPYSKDIDNIDRMSVPQAIKEASKCAYEAKVLMQERFNIDEENSNGAKVFVLDDIQQSENDIILAKYDR